MSSVIEPIRISKRPTSNVHVTQVRVIWVTPVILGLRSTSGSGQSDPLNAQRKGSSFLGEAIERFGAHKCAKSKKNL